VTDFIPTHSRQADIQKHEIWVILDLMKSFFGSTGLNYVIAAATQHASERIALRVGVVHN
jgi:hypothetical protein